MGGYGHASGHVRPALGSSDFCTRRCRHGDHVCIAVRCQFHGKSLCRHLFRYLPLANAALFLLGVWTVFDWGNPDFCGYAVAYLAVSVLTMLITVVVVRNVRKELNNK